MKPLNRIIKSICIIYKIWRKSKKPVVPNELKNKALLSAWRNDYHYSYNDLLKSLKPLCDNYHLN